MTVYVCQGSGCRKEKKQARRVLAVLSNHDVEVVRCQKICDGPVIGCAVDGNLEWFKDIDNGRVRRAVTKLLEEGKIVAKLKSRRVKKRAGKLRT